MTFVICDLPFSIIENLWFVDVLKSLQLNYNLLTHEYLVSSLLNNEAVRINYEIKIALKNSKNLISYFPKNKHTFFNIEVLIFKYIFFFLRFII